jgi:probable O-glycosylation ligase (exosortase A-associated)
MLRSLWLLGLYLAFLALGVVAPFVMTLGYVWVDTFRPQEVAWFILNELPVSLIMGSGAVASYFLVDRRSPPPLTLLSILQVMFAIWMTTTLLWAEVPGAWIKWDVAFKAVVFAAFVPLVIRSRVQIEAFVTTWVFSLAANFIPFGVKTLISGGGYGQNLGLQGGNGGLAEGGQLSTFCLMAVPLLLFLGKHGQLLPRVPMIKVAYAGAAILAIVTALGTRERSAIVGLVAIGFFMFLRSRRKFLYVILASVLTITVVGQMVVSLEDSRSILNYNTDNSALVRLGVWKWTLAYVSTHPLGGSFNAYAINTFVLPDGEVQSGRAWHSIYFEMLGELGWPGLSMFLMVIGSTYFSLLRLSRKCRKLPEFAWVADMSDAILSGLAAFLSAGAFVGIAFQPPFWYFVSMAVCLRAYVTRAERSEPQGSRVAALRRREEIAAGVSMWQEAPVMLGGESLRAPGWRGRARPRRET